MARLGFYNIMTIECLSRQINTRNHQFAPLTKEMAEKAKNNTASAASDPALEEKVDGKMIARRRK